MYNKVNYGQQESTKHFTKYHM